MLAGVSVANLDFVLYIAVSAVIATLSIHVPIKNLAVALCIEKTSVTGISLQQRLVP